MNNIDKKCIYRITHIDNIPHILQYGIVHSLSKNRNNNYVSIGDKSLIEYRNCKIVSVDNKNIILGDFIPFYFGAIPPLGAGNGGLNWGNVKKIIEYKLSSLSIDVIVFEPSATIVEKMKSERVKLTPARALLLYVLFDLVRHGEYVSEFSSEKVCYFLQRFGADELFRLNFEPKYYGPYSGKVRYVLNALNGSYIMGYSDMDKKPFESLSLIADSYEQIEDIINHDNFLKTIATKTKNLLDGFYSDFGLELLSSIDYLMSRNGNISVDEIHDSLLQWSHRKGMLFSDNKYIEIAKNHLLKSELYHNSI